MRASELKGRDVAELQRELANVRRGLFDLRFKWQAEENPDTSRRRRLRRDAARILTVLRQKETEAQGQQQGADA